MSINFYNLQNYALPPNDRTYFPPVSNHTCSEDELIRLGYSEPQKLLSSLKQERQALLTGEPLPSEQRQADAGSSARSSASGASGAAPASGGDPAASDSALSARLKKGMNGWVNDTWRILKKGEHGWTKWNGPVLKMNFPDHYCFQNNLPPYQCYYRVVTRKTAANLSCRPGHCRGVMTLRHGLISRWPGYEVGTAWHDGKLALTFINPFDINRPGTRNTAAQWDELCTKRVMIGNPVGVPLPECFYGGAIEDGKETRVQGCGQTGCPYITWVALAISPDSKNRHHGGAHIAASNTPVGAYGAAMQYCEILSTTGNCFVVEVIPTQPGNSAVSPLRANGDPNWP